MHPKKVKEDLAAEIVDRFHGVGAGALTKAEFEKVLPKKIYQLIYLNLFLKVRFGFVKLC